MPPVITGTKVIAFWESCSRGTPMDAEYEVRETLDAKGQVCPIPLAKTKGAIESLADGDVLEVLATERNSVPDFESWAEITDGVELLGQVEDDEGGEPVYRHYIEKTG